MRKPCPDAHEMYGDVLLLRHVLKLLAIDVRLRIKISSLRGGQQEIRQKLICNSIMWNLYAVSYSQKTGFF
jgi:hypothetical protein